MGTAGTLRRATGGILASGWRNPAPVAPCAVRCGPPGGAVEFAMLGPLVVRADGAELALGAAKPRALLVRFLIDANRVVAADRLIDDLWEGDPPPSAGADLAGLRLAAPQGARRGSARHPIRRVRARRRAGRARCRALRIRGRPPPAPDSRPSDARRRVDALESRPRPVAWAGVGRRRRRGLGLGHRRADRRDAPRRDRGRARSAASRSATIPTSSRPRKPRSPNIRCGSGSGRSS